MDYEAEISKLLAQAEPLRALDDDDTRKEELRVIVDEINVLRAKQAQVGIVAEPVAQPVVEGADADPVTDLEAQAKSLGITVDRRWSPATLQARIDEVLAK